MEGFVPTINWRSAFIRFGQSPLNIFSTCGYNLVDVGKHKNMTLIVRLSPSKVVCGGGDHIVFAFDRSSKQLLKPFHGHSGSVRAIQFDDEQLFSGSADNSWIHWDWATGAQRHADSSHTGEVNCVKYDDRVLATSSDDNTVRLFDVRSYQSITTLRPQHPGAVYNLQLTGNTLMSVCNKGMLVEWDLRRQKGLHMSRLHRDGVFNVHFTPKEIVCSGAGQLFFVNRKAWSVESVRFAGQTKAYGFHADEDVCAIGCGRTVLVMDRQSRKVIRKLEAGGELYNVCFDSQAIAVAGFHSRVQMFEFDPLTPWNGVGDEAPAPEDAV